MKTLFQLYRIKKSMLAFAYYLSATFLLFFVSANETYAHPKGNNNSEKKVIESKKPTLKRGDHVLVTLKDGREVKAIVKSRETKNKYYVRQLGSSRQGSVKSKFLKKIETTKPKFR